MRPLVKSIWEGLKCLILDIFMGFKSYFKRFLSKGKENAKETKKIKAEEIGDWIKNKKSSIREREKGAIEQLKGEIERFGGEVDDRIEVLKKVSVGGNRAPDKVKMVVKKNLDKYVSNLEKFIGGLAEIDERDIERFISKIDESFSKFDKNSRMNYEKATILVGKEMESVKKSLIGFSKSIRDMAKSNDGLIKEVKGLRQLKKILEEVKETRDAVKGILGDISDYENRKTELNKEIEGLEREVEGKKKGESYKGWVASKDEKENLRKMIDKNVEGLNKLIDFKMLAKYWHGNKEEMEIVKLYWAGFESAFQKDRGSVLRTLVRSLENGKQLEGLLSEVIELEKKLEKFEIGESPIREIEKEIGRKKEEVKQIASEVDKKRKILRKLEVNKGSVLSGLKEELNGFDVAIDDNQDSDWKEVEK